jgi:choline transport protein
LLTWFLAYFLPTDAASMNYNSVILVGCFAAAGIWWFAHGIRHYPGPKLVMLYLDGIDIKPDHKPDDKSYLNKSE